jgi:carbamoyltransferase
VALNCVANGRLLREGPFEDIWIQPAAGDAGGALGAALMVWHQVQGQPREADGVRDAMQGAYLGPAFPTTRSRRS